MKKNYNVFFLSTEVANKKHRYLTEVKVVILLSCKLNLCKSIGYFTYFIIFTSKYLKSKSIRQPNIKYRDSVYKQFVFKVTQVHQKI